MIHLWLWWKYFYTLIQNLETRLLLEGNGFSRKSFTVFFGPWVVKINLSFQPSMTNHSQLGKNIHTFSWCILYWQNKRSACFQYFHHETNRPVSRIPCQHSDTDNGDVIFGQNLGLWIKLYCICSLLSKLVPTTSAAKLDMACPRCSEDSWKIRSF